MKFTCSSGQRPLDGFTLKRGIGRGGFGEVYFAVSDGGKEVALKLLRDNREVELRGVAQCLNLKHANLVHLYDLRTDGNGDRWVVMEYVAGDSLQTVLSRHSDGLPRELVHEWFAGLTRAVAYLHDHGIVHRDLKPGNVFIENGIVKVGDYGLSKSITGSQRTAQTQSIGTVHYMAPEISTGNYNKSIDIYAAGIILYEMLTGHVPFDGESAGEILMKHLTAPPDLSKVPKEFVPVLSKALSKNPVQRYATLAEMADAIEDTSPALAAQLGSPSPLDLPPSPSRPVGLRAAPSPAESSTRRSPLSTGAALLELSGSLALAVILAAVGTAGWAAFMHNQSSADLGSIFLVTVGACWAVLVPTKFWTAPVEDSWTRRMALLASGCAVALLALWVEGWTLDGADNVGGRAGATQSTRIGGVVVAAGLSEAAAYLCYFAIVFLMLRWWKSTERQRPTRFSLAPVFATGFWALMLTLLWPTMEHGAVALVFTGAIVQMVSPWEQTPAPVAKRMRLRYA